MVRRSERAGQCRALSLRTTAARLDRENIAGKVAAKKVTVFTFLGHVLKISGVTATATHNEGRDSGECKAALPAVAVALVLVSTVSMTRFTATSSSLIFLKYYDATSLYKSNSIGDLLHSFK